MWGFNCVDTIIHALVEIAGSRAGIKGRCVPLSLGDRERETHLLIAGEGNEHLYAWEEDGNH